MILALRTDKPTAELYLLDDKTKVDKYSWEAHRQLADSLLLKIKGLLDKNKITLNDLTGIIIFTGEGSFTGLRIGTATANALAYGLNIPITASKGEKWIELGLENIASTKVGEFVVPEYSAEPNITRPKND
jgi:tRNA threonylcarbamoyl adenosine modification protein YeaZ